MGRCHGALKLGLPGGAASPNVWLISGQPRRPPMLAVEALHQCLPRGLESAIRLPGMFSKRARNKQHLGLRALARHSAPCRIDGGHLPCAESSADKCRGGSVSGGRMHDRRSFLVAGAMMPSAHRGYFYCQGGHKHSNGTGETRAHPMMFVLSVCAEVSACCSRLLVGFVDKPNRSGKAVAHSCARDGTPICNNSFLIYLSLVVPHCNASPRATLTSKRMELNPVGSGHKSLRHGALASRIPCHLATWASEGCMPTDIC